MEDYEKQLWDAVPSTVSQPAFIVIRSRETFNMDRRVFHNRLHTKGGHWILLSDDPSRTEGDFPQHDMAWGKIRELIREGVVIQGNCSTLAPNPNFPNAKPIFCHTEDFTNKQNVREVAEQIRRVIHYPTPMWYRLNARKQIGDFPPRDFYLYKHTINNELFECDVSTTPWSWVLVPPNRVEN